MCCPHGGEGGWGKSVIGALQSEMNVWDRKIKNGTVSELTRAG